MKLFQKNMLMIQIQIFQLKLQMLINNMLIIIMFHLLDCRDAFRYLMEDVNESSSENNINVTGIVDFNQSPHQVNKKVYTFTLIKDTDGSNDYRLRIGFNLFKLPLGYYTFVAEYFPTEMTNEMTNVIVKAQRTTISINSQTSNKICKNAGKVSHYFYQNDTRLHFY